MSEIAKYRKLLIRYCYDEHGDPAPGIDLGSSGEPLAPWGWSLDLPPADYSYYNSGNKPWGPIQLFGSAFSRFVEDNSLSWICCSHVLEDRPQSQWPDIFRLWMQALRPGGFLIVLVPEFNRWNEAIKNGQTPNCSHSAPEPSLGDLSRSAREVGLDVIDEFMTDIDPSDYTIAGIFQKPRLAMESNPS